MKNFRVARKLRRKIVRQLELQQSAEARAAVDLRNAIIGITRSLLQQFSVLLEAYGSDGATSAADNGIYQAIWSEDSLQEWVVLREKDAGISARLNLLKCELDLANKEYYEIAPFGRLSTIGKGTEKRHMIEALKARRDMLSTDLDVAQSDKDRNASALRGKTEELLRRAMDKGSLERIVRKSGPAASEIKQLVERMAVEVGGIWRRHCELQQQSLSEVTRLVREIAASYSEPAIMETLLPRS